MSVLRRHRILADDVRRVIGHLKAHKKITENDILSRPRLKKKKNLKGASPEEPIPWSHAELAGSWQQKDLKPGPANSNVLYAKGGDVWKLVVPEEDVEKFLRHSLTDPKSKMPLGRDSAYHHVQKGTIGISRRALYKFLEKQGVLQITKNIPNEQQKSGIKLSKRGYLEMDLIEGKGADLYKYFGASGDWYWLAVCDVLTGYGLVATILRKKPEVVAPALRELIEELEGDMHAKVKTIAADHGREFYTDVRALLKRRRIAQKQVPRGSRVEKFNQDFQRNFYRLMRLGRGTFGELEDQARDLTNNTRNKHTRKTPKEALDMPDAELAVLYNAGREEKGKKAYKGQRLPKVGDKCRVLIKQRKNMRPMINLGKHWNRLYKSYHGIHFTKAVYKIASKTKQDPPRYYVNGSWRDRDELLLISGVDAETERQVAARAK